MNFEFSLEVSRIISPLVGDRKARVLFSTLVEDIVSRSNRASEAFRGCTRSIEDGVQLTWLSETLMAVVPFDSAVRDLATTGHIGKLVLRFGTLRLVKDVRLVGLPHSIFDEISQRERARFFEKGSHVFDADLFQSKEILAMLEREALSAGNR